MQRPTVGETEEEILEQQIRFSQQPQTEHRATVVNNSQDSMESNAGGATLNDFSGMQEALGEVRERPHISQLRSNGRELNDTVVGGVREKQFEGPKNVDGGEHSESFPTAEWAPLQARSRPGRSQFALSGRNAARSNGQRILFSPTARNIPRAILEQSVEEMEEVEEEEMEGAVGGVERVLIDPTKQMQPSNDLFEGLSAADANAQIQEILSEFDSHTIQFLRDRHTQSLARPVPQRVANPVDMHSPAAVEEQGALPPGNAAVDLIEMNMQQHWLHFDQVEKEKLKWLSNIPTEPQQPNGMYEARFNWKGLLMPYSIDDQVFDVNDALIDRRDLYLHGDEPHRPGYTLQELFRFARSNVQQQRITALDAIAGILTYYNQGFYDNVIDVPVSKIFFLLRLACDETPVMIVEAGLNGMAKLVYNEVDEHLLDIIYETPKGYVQPSFDRCIGDTQPVVLSALLNTEVSEAETSELSRRSDFALAESDLIECLLRSRMVDRICYILSMPLYDNAVISCLKILIRLARKSEEIANIILADDLLIKGLFQRFLTPFAIVDTEITRPSRHNFPQKLCLKLLRILIAQSSKASMSLLGKGIISTLRGLMFTTDNLRSNSIEVQIEALRVLHTMLVKKSALVDVNLFIPALNYMLMLHFRQLDFQMGVGSCLLHQHAAALLNTLTAMPDVSVFDAAFAHTLRCCCNKWLTQATAAVANENFQAFSQVNLLTAVLKFLQCFGLPLYFRDMGYFSKLINNFINSPTILKFVRNIFKTSILVRKRNTDRHMFHKALPNAGAVKIDKNGPEVIVSQVYPFYLLFTMCRMLDAFGGRSGIHSTHMFLQKYGLTNLRNYINEFVNASNDVLCRNFFAKTEIKFIFYLQNTGFMRPVWGPSNMLQLSYKMVTVATADFIKDIRNVVEHMLFNPAFVKVHYTELYRWSEQYLSLLPIFDKPPEFSMVLPSHGRTLLPNDWPYIFLLQMYECLMKNRPSLLLDAEIIKMTFGYVTGMEEVCANVNPIAPEKQLMFFMMGFMSINADFLIPDVCAVLARGLRSFYKRYANHNFNFDNVNLGEYTFESLYYMFVDQYQAVSYGNVYFASLVMVPLAQRCNKKWRLRVWSEMVFAFATIECPDLLLGGMQAYIDPPETDRRMIAAYHRAVRSVRLSQMAFYIASKHLNQYIIRRRQR